MKLKLVQCKKVCNGGGRDASVNLVLVSLLLLCLLPSTNAAPQLGHRKGVLDKGNSNTESSSDDNSSDNSISNTTVAASAAVRNATSHKVIINKTNSYNNNKKHSNHYPNPKSPFEQSRAVFAGVDGASKKSVKPGE